MSENKKTLGKDLWELTKFIISPPIYASIRIYQFLSKEKPKQKPETPPADPPK